VNNKRNIVAVELKAPREAVIGELLKVTRLGKWLVNYYQPGRDIGCSAVIGTNDKVRRGSGINGS
jgi:hypothetical protein